MELRSSKALLQIWHLRIQRAARAHYMEAARCKRTDTALTVANVAASIVLVTASSAYWLVNANFAALNAAIGLAAILNVVTSILQYVLDYKSSAAEHKNAGSEYAMLNRAIEIALLKSTVDDVELKKLADEIDGLGDAAPVIRQRVWDAPNISGFTRRIEDLEEAFYRGDNMEPATRRAD